MPLPEMRGEARLLNHPTLKLGKNGRPFCHVTVQFGGGVKAIVGADRVETVAVLSSFRQGEAVAFWGTARPAVYDGRPLLHVHMDEAFAVAATDGDASVRADETGLTASAVAGSL